MNEHILEALNEEIARLQQVRAILSGETIPNGRKGQAATEKTAEKPRRILSPKARRAIAEAQHRRWERVHSMKNEAVAQTSAIKKEPAAG